MATVLHSSLTTSELHEPKGVSTATSGQVYVANGSGGGTWTTQTPASFGGIGTGAILVADGSDGFTSTTSWPNPTGVAANYVYTSDGLNSGSWVGREENFSTSFEDVSSASTVYVPIPFAGTVKKITTVLEAAVTASDSILTVSNSAAASMGTITVAHTGSASGDVDTLVPASNNVLTDGDFITIASDGASNGPAKLWVTVTVERS